MRHQTSTLVAGCQSWLTRRSPLRVAAHPAVAIASFSRLTCSRMGAIIRSRSPAMIAPALLVIRRVVDQGGSWNNFNPDRYGTIRAKWAS
jgi:hypothetical protein